MIRGEKMLKRILILALLSQSILASYLIQNFHTVEEGALYRSAQLSKNQYKRKIKRYGIKTIINLRGASTKKWYKREKEIAKKWAWSTMILE